MLYWKDLSLMILNSLFFWILFESLPKSCEMAAPSVQSSEFESNFMAGECCLYVLKCVEWLCDDNEIQSSIMDGDASCEEEMMPFPP